VLGFFLCVRCAYAEDASNRTSEAQRLANESLEALKRGDALQENWKPQYDRGIDLANQAIQVDPSVADAYYALFVNEGRVADRTGLASKALKVSRLRSLLAKTLELNPRHAHAWEAQGEMLLRLPRLLGGSTKDGEQSLRRAAELAPTWAKPRLRLAELDWNEGRAEQARIEAAAARDLARAAGDQDYASDAEALLTQMASKGS
jgi:hypothetical protein